MSEQAGVTCEPLVEIVQEGILLHLVTLREQRGPQAARATVKGLLGALGEGISIEDVRAAVNRMAATGKLKLSVILNPDSTNASMNIWVSLPGS